jgi:hypothetical protein
MTRRRTLTRLAALGTLSRSAGEGGPNPQGWVGEGNFANRLRHLFSRQGEMPGAIALRSAGRPSPRPSPRKRGEGGSSYGAGRFRKP